MQEIITDNKAGILLNPTNIKLYRQYFNEMVRLIGIQVLYAPLINKNYTIHGELNNNPAELEQVGCIFDEHPTQQTMRKLGWNTDAQESASLISVPYDLHDLQRGALFVVPSGLDNAAGRWFKVDRLLTTALYPASITCRIYPEYGDTLPNSKQDHTLHDFNYLAQEDDQLL